MEKEVKNLDDVNFEGLYKHLIRGPRIYENLWDAVDSVNSYVYDGFPPEAIGVGVKVFETLMELGIFKYEYNEDDGWLWALTT